MRIQPLLVPALLCGLLTSAHADSASHREASFASGTGNLIFLAAGTLLPLAEKGKEGEQRSVRTADAALTATVFTEALKHLVRERRPDGSDRDSFPSGHATAAFAVATMESQFHPRQSWLWYTGATVIAVSRVQLHRHYSYDVAAGAAVGFFTAKLELREKRGLLLFPFIRPQEEGGGGGVGVTRSW